MFSLDSNGAFSTFTLTVKAKESIARLSTSPAEHRWKTQKDSIAIYVKIYFYV